MAAPAPQHAMRNGRQGQEDLRGVFLLLALSLLFYYYSHEIADMLP